MQGEDALPQSGSHIREIRPTSVGDRDVVLMEKDKNRKFNEAFHMSPPPSTRASAELDRPVSSEDSVIKHARAMSDTSSEVIILQKYPEDEEHWRRDMP